VRIADRDVPPASSGVTDDTPRTVTFQLAWPDPDFLYELTEFAYTAPVPPGTPNRDMRWQPLPGTGPYRIVEASHDRVRLERNPYFHEWSHAAQPGGNPDTILWQFPPSHDAEIRKIERGEADWTLDFIPVPHLRAIERTRPALLHVNPAFIVEFIPLNTQRPPFDNVKVRQALNYAIDRRRIARLYGGSVVATPLCQPLAPGMPGYVRYCPYTIHPDARGTYTGPNLSRARKLVVASGRSGSHVDVWGTTDEAAIPPGLPAYVAHVLRSLGFTVKLHIVHFDTITNAERRTFQLSTDGDWLPDFPLPTPTCPRSSAATAATPTATTATRASTASCSRRRSPASATQRTRRDCGRPPIA
jgi:peptide/nickel transport system substrate-binding protein